MQINKHHCWECGKNALSSCGGEAHRRERNKIICLVCRTYLVRDIMEEMQLNGLAPDRQFLESAIRSVALWTSFCCSLT